MKLRNCFLWLISIAVLVLIILLTYKNQYEIDAHTGKIRYTKHLLGFIVYENIKDTKMSTILSNYCNYKKPLWKKDSTFSFYNPHVSPHYRQHGTIHKINIIMNIIDHNSIPKESQEKLCLFITLLLENDIKVWILPHIESECNDKQYERIVYFIKKLDFNNLSQEYYRKE